MIDKVHHIFLSRSCRLLLILTGVHLVAACSILLLAMSLVSFISSALAIVAAVGIITAFFITASVTMTAVITITALWFPVEKVDIAIFPQVVVHGVHTAASIGVDSTAILIFILMRGIVLAAYMLIPPPRLPGVAMCVPML